MAFATSIPELLVGISSAIQDVPEISLGNILGANIIDMTLLVGIFVVLNKGIKTTPKKIDKEVYFTLASIVLLLVLYLIGNSLSRIDGAILLALFVWHNYLLIKKRKKHKRKLRPKKEEKRKLEYLLLFIVSLLVLFVSSRFVVQFTNAIATDLNLSGIFIGLFLISIATTLPELIFGINAVLLKHPQMSIGDQAGTVFTNTCLVLGVASIISPIKTSLSVFLTSGIFLLISALTFVYFLKSGKKLDVREGIILIILYLIFVGVQIVLGVR